jgi:hypothetical protein
LETKGYGIKNSIANFMNQFSCTLEYSSHGRALLLLVSKQNLKPPPLGASNTLKIVENKLEMRKLWAPKVKGVKNSEKKPFNTTKANS